MVLELDLTPGRGACIEPLGDEGDCWASFLRFVRLLVHPPPNLPFRGGSSRLFCGELGAELRLMMLRWTRLCARGLWVLCVVPVSGVLGCDGRC